MILEIEMFVFVSEKPRNSLFEETVRWKTLYLCSVTCEIACSELPSSSNKLFHTEMKEFLYQILSISFWRVLLKYRRIWGYFIRQFCVKCWVNMQKNLCYSNEKKCHTLEWVYQTKLVAKLLLHPCMHVCCFAITWNLFPVHLSISSNCAHDALMTIIKGKLLGEHSISRSVNPLSSVYSS